MARTKTTKKTTKTMVPLPEQENLPPKWEAKLQKSDLIKDDWGGNHKRVEEILNEISILVCAGWTREMVAKHFNITSYTLYTWSRTNADLKTVLIASSKIADEHVETSLYDSCFDRTVKEVTVETDANNDIIKTITKTRVIPANPTAIQYWLSNRANDRWKARQQLDIGTTGTDAIPIKLVYDLDTPSESEENIPKDL